MNDEWHITIDTAYLHNQAGAGAREKAQELTTGKPRGQLFLERVFDARTDERSWRRGAEGEEDVARWLATLPRPWVAVHDLTIGRRGANLDHLLLGPAGVFVLNTKNLTGRLTVYDRAVLQNGHKTNFVPAVWRETKTVQERLSAALGRPVRAWGVLVVLGCEIQVKKPLADLALLTGHDVPAWFQRLPQDVIGEGDLLRLERAARDPETWIPTRARPEQATSTPSPTLPPPGGSAPADAGGDITVQRWQRFGKDRLYANGPDGERLGYLDLLTDEVHLEVPDIGCAITRELRSASAKVEHAQPATHTERDASR